MGRNHVNLENVSKAFDIKVLLYGVSCGISEGERIGIVGRNGAGKSTLLKVISGNEEVDSGRVSRSSESSIGILTQVDFAEVGATVGDVVLGRREKYEWASDARVREVFTGLFGGFDDHIFERDFNALSGGEKRRVSLAKLLIEDVDLLLLDEPTNHLDVEGVAWLANFLNSRKDLSVAVITHDRWFLDAVTEMTWEVVGGKVEEYDGGYSAYVLAKAERARQAAASDSRRANLIRKELAWLRRGAPARTSKPKFRVDTANELIAHEPPPRDSVELLKFAQHRLGKTVFELHHAQVSAGEKILLDDVYWNIGPGNRIGIVGVNGAGKTTLLRILAGLEELRAGKLVRGVTVKVGFLTQHLDELDPTWRVLEAVERVAQHIEIGGGKVLSASQLCERLGFGPSSQWTPVGDLSGGERRRLQLTRILMESPNVLMLDEPTNDFDIETLTELEDLLDSFAGTLIVVSHDRYFLERTCDSFVGLYGDGSLRDLPRGVEQYLHDRTLVESEKVEKVKPTSHAAEQRQAKKDLARLEKQIEKIKVELVRLEKEQEEAAFDSGRLHHVSIELERVRKELDEREEEWLSLSLLI